MGLIGGGLLTITAKAKIDGNDRQGTYDGKIEGERTTDGFRTKMIEYLKLKGEDVKTDLGSADVLFALACIETYGVNHFYPPIVAGDKIPDGSQNGEPKGANYPFENTSGDGGFGVMQLTDPKPTYRQIWHWKENIDKGVGFVNEKIGMAKNHYNKHPVADNEKAEFLRWDVYQQYNGFHFWEWMVDPKDKKEKWIGKRDQYNKKTKKYEVRYGWMAKRIEEQLARGEIPSEY